MDRVDFLMELNTVIGRLNKETDYDIATFLIKRISGMCARECFRVEKKASPQSSDNHEDKVYSILQKHRVISRQKLLTKCQFVNAAKLTEIMDKFNDNSLIYMKKDGRALIYHICTNGIK